MKTDTLMALADAYATCEFAPHTRGKHKQFRDDLEAELTRFAAAVRREALEAFARGLMDSRGISDAEGEKARDFAEQWLKSLKSPPSSEPRSSP